MIDSGSRVAELIGFAPVLVSWGQSVLGSVGISLHAALSLLLQGVCGG